MADKISDNVGKKIVEALKMQNHEDISPEDSLIDSPAAVSDVDFETTGVSDFINSSVAAASNEDHLHDSGFGLNASDTDIDSAFNSSIAKNLGANVYVQPQADFELPNNVAILNRLIAKLPVGVSKQTGAAIISQTMEALGISMNSVIQEAKAVQDTLTNNARECQKTIIDYRKQISELELKAQQYQRQAVVMNDVINLFTRS